MIHTETKSEKETNARVKYASAEQVSATADEALAAKVAELLALRHKMDRDELRKSELMGEIMDAMKKATVLKDGTGRVIVTWKEASVKSKVNYAGLLKKYKVTKEDLEAFTTTSRGARTFEIIEDESECPDWAKEI
jgi:hypothetical protein